jgi:hypothetical protein
MITFCLKQMTMFNTAADCEGRRIGHLNQIKCNIKLCRLYFSQTYRISSQRKGIRVIKMVKTVNILFWACLSIIFADQVNQTSLNKVKVAFYNLIHLLSGLWVIATLLGPK